MVGRRESLCLIASRREIDARHEIRALAVAEQIARRVALRHADGIPALEVEDGRGGPTRAQPVGQASLRRRRGNPHDRRQDDTVRHVEDAAGVVDQRVEAFLAAGDGDIHVRSRRGRNALD